MSLVSIILPYYKKINFFAATYRSIIRQSYQNYELIIIYDDKDLTELRAIQEIINKNPKVKILQNNRNLGAGLSRNYGIKKSKGKFISFIDADDIWNKNKIKEQVKFIEKNKFDFTCCNYKKKISNKIINVKPQYKIEYQDLIESCSIGLSTVMLRKKIFNKKIKFPSIKTKEDFVLWLNLLKNGEKIFAINKNLVTWKKTSDSLSSSTIQKIIDAYRVYYLYMNFNFIKSVYYVFLLSINFINKSHK